MNKHIRFKKNKRLPYAKALLPIALTTILFGCKQDFTPDEEGEVDNGNTPVVTVPLTYPERTGRAMEFLDRGLVVVPARDEDDLPDGNILSWRALGSDGQRTSYKIFKNDQSITVNYLIDETFYQDKEGSPTDVYQVKGYIDDVEVTSSKKLSAWEQPYLSIPLDKPENGYVEGEEYSYSANDASAADLDGDGQYEMLVKWYPSNAKDNGHDGATGNTYIDAYTLEGAKLWRIDLGPNIRSGAHYTQFIAYDFDQNGRAEIAMKTADGTVDGRGNVIGDPDALYRGATGRILDGPEFLTMFDGLSGEAIDTINYNPPRGNVSDWGDDYGNRVDRFLAGIAYLGDEAPSLLMARGYYTRAVVAAYDWVNNKFVERWVFDTDNGGADALVAGQGAHSLTIGDVDADGYDEIIYGAATIDNDGSASYSTELGHGDALHLGDIDPNRPGLEIFMVHESPSQYTKNSVEYAVELHDAETGEIIWHREGGGSDVGRGVSVDIDPTYPGNESWGSRGGLIAADGTVIIEEDNGSPLQKNFAIWWDGDLTRELLDGVDIFKWDHTAKASETIFDGNYKPEVRQEDDNKLDYDLVSNNGTKATPSLSADIFGDWREEIVFANSDSTELRIVTTTIPTDFRLPTLMHDSQYRTAIAWQNVAYNQPPHPSFYLGSDIDPEDRFVVRDFPQYKNKTVEPAPLKQMVAQGNSDSVVINVYLNEVEADSIEIFRNTSDDIGGRISVGVLANGQTTFEDKTAVADVTYYYWAVLSDSNGAEIEELAFSKTKLTSTLLPTIRFDAISTPNNVELDWSTKNIDAETVAIYRADAVDESTIPDISTRVLIGNPLLDETHWIDNTTVEGGKYFYWIAFELEDNTVVESEPAFGLHIITQRTNLNTQYTDDGILISWNLENYDDVIGSQLYRNEQPTTGGRTRLSVLPSEDVFTGSFLDTTALPDVKYWYMFKLTLNDNSTPSTPVEGEITNTANLTNLTAVYSGNQIDVSWNLQNFPQDFKSIELYRNTSNTTSGRTRIIPSASGLPGAEAEGTLVDTNNLVDGETYWYMFKIILADDTRIDTAPEAETLYSLPTPTANLFSSLLDGGVNLTWKLENFFDPIKSIELYRNTTNTAEGSVLIASNLTEQSTYLDTANLEENESYWYMFKVTFDDDSVFFTEAEAEIEYEAAPLITSIMLEEKQPGTCGADGENGSDGFEAINAGFTGEGYLNTANELNKGAYWKVNVAEAGTYTFTFVFANGSQDNRWGRLDVNGSEAVTQVDLPGDGSWTSYNTVSVDVDLSAGEADIALIARTAGGLANIDSLTIASTTGGNAPTAVACD